MAFIKDIMVIQNMTDSEGNSLGEVEVQAVEGEDTCVQIYQAVDEASQAIWFDIEGATLLRDYLNRWFESKKGQAKSEAT